MSEFAVELRGIQKRYGQVVAVESIDLAVAEGEFLSFLGPSGCGKTTTLRMIAGLETPSEGDILIKGQRVNDVPIHKRNIGIVFQNYALFPHRSVFNNVAFGLRFRGCSKDEIKRRVADALSLVQLQAMANRYPAALSGGQQQRVALARAIVIKPDLLLLDEPLSALDANLREDMRIELKQIQQETGITTLFITHDQSEALAMSDRIAVMSNGRVEQLDTPQVVYNRPSSQFCANFLGNANVLDGKVIAGEPGAWEIDVAGRRWLSGSLRRWDRGQAVAVVMRAEHFDLSRRLAANDATAPAGTGMEADTVDKTVVESNSTEAAVDPGLDKRAVDASNVDAGKAVSATANTVAATVSTVDYLGMSVRYFVQIPDAGKLEVISGVRDRLLTIGTQVNASIQPRDVILLPADKARA